MRDRSSQHSGLCRFQIQRDRDGRHRWYLFNAYGTMVGRHLKDLPEREARLDVEQLREQLATAPFVGEVDEGTG